jgi:hypothetical protein
MQRALIGYAEFSPTKSSEADDLVDTKVRDAARHFGPVIYCPSGDPRRR